MADNAPSGIGCEVGGGIEEFTDVKLTKNVILHIGPLSSWVPTAGAR